MLCCQNIFCFFFKKKTNVCYAVNRNAVSSYITVYVLLSKDMLCVPIKYVHVILSKIRCAF